MNISYVKTVIERAKSSLESSTDETYKQAIEQKIYDVEYAICLDQEVGDISHIEDTRELTPYLIPKVEDLEQSI